MIAIFRKTLRCRCPVCRLDLSLKGRKKDFLAALDDTSAATYRGYVVADVSNCPFCNTELTLTLGRDVRIVAHDRAWEERLGKAEDRLSTIEDRLELALDAAKEQPNHDPTAKKVARLEEQRDRAEDALWAMQDRRSEKEDKLRDRLTRHLSNRK